MQNVRIKYNWTRIGLLTLAASWWGIACLLGVLLSGCGSAPTEAEWLEAKKAARVDASAFVSRMLVNVRSGKQRHVQPTAAQLWWRRLTN